MAPQDEIRPQHTWVCTPDLCPHSSLTTLFQCLEGSRATLLPIPLKQPPFLPTLSTTAPHLSWQALLTQFLRPETLKSPLEPTVSPAVGPDTSSLARPKSTPCLGPPHFPWLLWGCSRPQAGPRQWLPNLPCDPHSCHPAPLDLVPKGNQNDLGKHKCAWSHTPTSPHLEGQLKHSLKLPWSGQRHPLTSPQASDHTSTSGSLHYLPGAPPPRWGNGHPITALDLDSCDITSETSPQIIHRRAPLLPCDPTPCPVCYLSWFSRSWTLDSALTHLDNINLHCVTEH